MKTFIMLHIILTWTNLTTIVCFDTNCLRFRTIQCWTWRSFTIIATISLSKKIEIVFNLLIYCDTNDCLMLMVLYVLLRLFVCYVVFFVLILCFGLFRFVYCHGVVDLWVWMSFWYHSSLFISKTRCLMYAYVIDNKRFVRLVPLFVRSFVSSFVPLFSHPFIRSVIVIHSFVQSFIHSFVHSFM